ncbi:MAG TPA: carboxypeptidase-like regulatory domain-containing protein, partial [Phnomibacter sp.]|nr:carboxypeptidase-like regulatory domain-containing protein [Phnomibacter sp.]
MRKLTLTLFGLLALICFHALGQAPVAGKVTDTNGNPIPSASVLQKGTQNGTTTDESGNFTLLLPPGAILEISAVGFETLEIEAEKAVDIILKPTSGNLSEVVVTGVGAATSRRKLAIDVASLAMRNAGKSAVASVEQALQGQIAGATVQFTSGLPGSRAQIVLRGLNDLAGTGPIILVDGIEIKTGLTGLDLSAVERVEVVKGAAAGTLYGAQGAGGVIQIFTKRGSRVGKKLQIDLRQQLSFDGVIRQNDLMATHHHFITTPDGFIARGGQPIRPDENGGWPDPSFLDAGLSGQAAADVQNNLPYKEKLFDHISQAYRQAMTSNTNLHLSGGQAGADYAFNIGLLNQENVLFNGYERYNLGVNLGLNLARGFSFRTNTQLIYTDEDLLAGGSRFNLTNSWPFIDFTTRDIDGNITVKPKVNDTQLNPLSEREWRTRSSKNTRVLQNFNLNYKFPRFVELDYKYGLDHSMDDLQDLYKNQTNAPQSGSGFWGSTVEGSITGRMNKFTFQNSLATAFFRLDLEDDIGLKIPLKSTTQVSYDWRKTQNRQYFAQGSQLPTFPPYNINVAAIKNSGSYEDAFVTFGILVNQTFDWGDLFGVSGGYRSDHSSDFGEGKGSQTFYRGSVYFRPSELIGSK